MKESKIVDSFRGKTLFVTGVTGFCGRVFLEKLVRTITTVDKVYVLVRPAKGLSPDERLRQMFKSMLFNFKPLPEGQLVKVVAIGGDITSPNCGLSEKDAQLLHQTVDIVYHVAASVKFDACFRTNLNANVNGVVNVVNFAKECHKLEYFIHVSTAFSNCQHSKIEEKIYPLVKDVDTLLDELNQMSDEELEVTAVQYYENRPNSYIFTKAIAENYVHKHMPAGIKTAIVRPSVVAPTFDEPIPGYVDSFNGPAGLSVVYSLGICQVLDWDFSNTVDGFPVDFLASALLAIPAYWTDIVHSDEEKPIFNLNSTTDMPLNNHQYMLKLIKQVEDKPSLYAVRPIATPPPKNTIGQLEYKVKCFFYHIVFAYIIDLLLFIFGQKRLMLRAVHKMHYATELMKYFANNEWSFGCENYMKLKRVLNDHEESKFRIDLTTYDVDYLAENIWLGIRRYLLKEDDKTIPVAKTKYRVLVVLYRMYQLALLYFALKLSLAWLPIDSSAPYQFLKHGLTATEVTATTFGLGS